MVEPSFPEDYLREATPKPTRNDYPPVTASSLPEVPGHENTNSASSQNLGGRHHLYQSDASEAMTDSRSTSDQVRHDLYRRHPQPAPTPHRPSNLIPSQPSQSYGPSSDSQINITSSPTGFQVPHIYPASSGPYVQRQSYVGQYTIPAPNIGPAPPSFAYPHGFHHTGMPDGSMVPQNIHTSYQPILQPPSSVYQYPRHSPEGSSSTHPSFLPGGSRMYAHHSVNPSPPPHSPLSPQSPTGMSSARSPTYAGTGQFHSLGYSSSVSMPPYTYPPQSFPTSPLYQSRYVPGLYAQPHPAHTEQEGQGSWWYLPHAAPSTSPGYEAQPSYVSHYPVPYPVNRSNTDPLMVQSGVSSSPSSTTGGLYQMSPRRLLGNLVSETSETPSSASSSKAPPADSPNPVVPVAFSSTQQAISEKPIVRRHYHPNPPAHRSEWVMWAGNVPSDATHDEAWHFFTSPPENQDGGHPENNGVLSIFLISRSSCVFVNFDNEAHLIQGTERFNGQPMRLHDPRCPRLVCRVRRRDDDLKAGVGGQRGSGMHMRWIKEQKGKLPDTGQQSEASTPDDPPTSPSSTSDAAGRVSLSSDEGSSHGLKAQSSSSGSYASTTSSILTHHFPKRYFILKSLTQYDLDLSVEKGLWATQKHNEGILDQAYRTSTDVYLIFGVNKSGEFYGYARMAGPVKQGEQRVSWASRSDSSLSSRSSRSATGRGSLQSETIAEEVQLSSPGQSTKSFFSPGEHRLVEQPLSPMSPSMFPEKSGPSTPKTASAPGRKHQQISINTPPTINSLDPTPVRGVAATFAAGWKEREAEFVLDKNAPYRAMRYASEPLEMTSIADALMAGQLDSVGEEEEKAVAEDELAPAAETPHEEFWGESFKVEWLCTERLPFYRTRHLRNPWNHDREVKVSRDGTELEPAIGQKLLEEWDGLSESAQQPTSRPGGGSRHGPKSPTSRSARAITEGASG